MSFVAHRSRNGGGRSTVGRPHRLIRTLRRRPALVVLLVLYVTALLGVHDVRTAAFGVVIAACSLLRLAMITRRSCRRAA